MSGRGLSISAFFPAYNDAESLRVLVPKMARILHELAGDFEIIVVDDGSADDTPAVLAQFSREYSCLRVIRHDQNRGYGAALRSGFQAATRDLVFYTDGDGQYDVAELKDLLERLGDGVDGVNGYKIRRADRFPRRLLGRAYRGLVRLLFGLKLRDVDCDFRLLRRSILNAMPLQFSSGAICAELMVQIERAGFRIEEVPVHHYPRLAGQSQFFRIRPVLEMVRDVFSLWYRLRRARGIVAGQTDVTASAGSSRPRV